jgi:hypothetical protein
MATGDANLASPGFKDDIDKRGMGGEPFGSYVVSLREVGLDGVSVAGIDCGCAAYLS